MSGNFEFYRDKFAAQVAKYIEAEARAEPDVPPEAWLALKNVLAETMNEIFRDGLWIEVERAKLIGFIDRLLHRQGTAIPDWDEIYRHKAELDRRLLDDPRP